MPLVENIFVNTIFDVVELLGNVLLQVVSLLEDRVLKARIRD
jgi:hypothetical protein